MENHGSLTLIQCNEAKPVCANCERHQLPCVYDRVTSQNSRATESASTAAEVTTSFDTPSSDLSRTTDAHITWTDVAEVPESSSRRKLELRLLHDYITRTGPTLGVDSASQSIWARTIPELACQSDALLYSICSVTALHEARLHGAAKPSTMETYQRYLGMAVRAHHLEVSRVSKENVDLICLTSSQLRLCAFDRLQDRPIKPYTPPLQWLYMCSTSAEIWRRVRQMAQEDKESIIVKWVQSMPNAFDDEPFMADENLRALSHLLYRTPDDILNEPWNEQIEKDYKFVVGYVGCVSVEIEKNNIGYAGRLLCVFPIRAPAKFVKSLESLRPRGLVILAHYFALLTLLSDYWYIGDCGAREVRAIATVLPPQWREHMKRPLELIETRRFVL